MPDPRGRLYGRRGRKRHGRPCRAAARPARDTTDLTIVGVSWQPLDGCAATGDRRDAPDRRRADRRVRRRPVIARCTRRGTAISLVVGPYIVAGELPTLPGFDPGRALTRPSGEFVHAPGRPAGARRRRDETVIRPARAGQPLRRRPGDGRHHARASSSRGPPWTSPTSRRPPAAGRRPPPARPRPPRPSRARAGSRAPAPVRRPRPSRAGRSRPDPRPAPACDERGARDPSGMTRRASTAVAPRRSGPARTPPRRSTGWPTLSIRWMPRSRSTSSMHTREIASPDRPGAAGPADPVDVVLRVPGQLEVHDDRQVLDVQAARGDVGGNEDADLTGLEALEGARPFGLRTIRVDGHRVQPFAVQL